MNERGYDDMQLRPSTAAAFLHCCYCLQASIRADNTFSFFGKLKAFLCWFERTAAAVHKELGVELLFERSNRRTGPLGRDAKLLRSFRKRF
ncbi:hypothetical protein CE91St30_01080 [Raoultibacter timonensis]|uniref:Uncharacterized protein n=1 Tax=Raoultibacter timonensis TaxID=1907662 RepID=A0ABM7WEW5_9ACTN|nr:hypothetical protein CE91St30_01080 [Raoultibacter timonensis]BDF49378.1 hypothetical protein CE91St31_01080 [Raoultibacter timonensis]